MGLLKTINIVGAAMALTMILTMALIKHIEWKPTPIIEDEIEVNDIMLLTEDNVKYWCQLLDIKHIDIVVAQSRLETGNYTSQKCLNFNNIFGFQRSNSRPLIFNHWIESIIFYKQWQDRYYNMGEYPNYYDFLAEYPYADDPEYVNKLKQF